MRTCSRCGKEKPRADFHVEPRVQDGLAAACRMCIKEKRAGKKRSRGKVYRKPEKERARGRVRDAVRYGKLAKPNRCDHCGRCVPKALLDGHHHDYSKPLEIVWLCRSCHGLESLGGSHSQAA